MITKVEQAWINTVFLALVVWREARGESVECQVAVAYSIMNRVEKPSSQWGKNVMGVIRARLQYSSMTYPKDKQLTTWPAQEDAYWQQCFWVACDVLSKQIDNPVPGVDSYHDISIPNPVWATDDKFVKQIGRIKFYNVDKDVEI